MKVLSELQKKYKDIYKKDPLTEDGDFTDKYNSWLNSQLRPSEYVCGKCLYVGGHYFNCSMA